MAGQNSTTVPDDVQERWLLVEGFPGYEVSDRGRVRSYWKRIGIWGGGSKFELYLHPQTILNPGVDPEAGYLIVGLYRDGKRYNRRVHRLVLLTFVGPCPPGFEGCHHDGIPENCALSNLRWDTKNENSLDSVLHGTHAGLARKGIKHPLVKLTDAQVLKIRELYAHGRLQKTIAEMFNISRQNIYSIVHRKSWTHI